MDSKAKLPYIHTPRPDASAAPAANSKHSSSALPPSERRALSTSYWQLVPGFICNMFLLTGQGDAPKLFGLQEWADGTGGASLRKQRWAAKSRRQVRAGTAVGGHLPYLERAAFLNFGLCIGSSRFNGNGVLIGAPARG